jgi:hypothetical protein
MDNGDFQIPGFQDGRLMEGLENWQNQGLPARTFDNVFSLHLKIYFLLRSRILSWVTGNQIYANS